MAATTFNLPFGNSGMAPWTCHVDAVDLVDALKVPHEDCVYAWDFGDPLARFNELPGFNAAHNYRDAGTYTITLRLTLPDGKVNVYEQSVNIAADTRAVLHVSHRGNDTNAGTIDKPIKTYAEAGRRLKADLNVRFERGGTYPVDAAGVWKFDKDAHNIRVNSYGGSGHATLLSSYATNADPILTFFDVVGGGGKNLIVEQLRFDSVNHSNDKYGKGQVVRPGENTTVRDCRMDYVSGCVNGETRGNGQLIQDCLAEHERSIAAYFIYGGGQRLVALGNRATNSTREHIMRMGGNPKMVLLFGNDLEQRDLRDLNGDGDSDDPGEDAIDPSKGVFVLQLCELAWMENNRGNGPNGAGPLATNNAGLPYAAKEHRATRIVVKNNLIQGGFALGHGTEHARILQNFLTNAEVNDVGTSPAPILEFQGYQKLAERGLRDIVVQDNDIIRVGARGPIFKQHGTPLPDGSQQVVVSGNHFFGQNLEAGGWGTCLMDIPVAGYRVDHNTLPSIKGSNWANKGIFIVPGAPKTTNGSHFVTAAEFEAFEWVGHNTYVPPSSPPTPPALPVADPRPTTDKNCPAPVVQREGPRWRFQINPPQYKPLPGGRICQFDLQMVSKSQEQGERIILTVEALAKAL